MAARAGDGGRLSLSPRGMRIAGWLAVVGVIGVVALVVGLLGGDAEESGVVPSPSASQAGPAPIAFGTGLDPTSGEVATAAATNRFVAGDTFAYSVGPAAGRPDVVHVEVERTAGGEVGIVQAAANARQEVPSARPVIAFTAPADDLLAVFGPGTYVMRIYADPAQPHLAEGTFELLADAPSAAP